MNKVGAGLPSGAGPPPCHPAPCSPVSTGGVGAAACPPTWGRTGIDVCGVHKEKRAEDERLASLIIRSTHNCRLSKQSGEGEGDRVHRSSNPRPDNHRIDDGPCPRSPSKQRGGPGLSTRSGYIESGARNAKREATDRSRTETEGVDTLVEALGGPHADGGSNPPASIRKQPERR